MNDREEPGVYYWWCPTCGIVHVTCIDQRTICRHNVGATPGPAASWTEPLPTSHPQHPAAA